jgi:hypothetical protein
MSDFPRTELGGISVSRMVMGSNWFLGFAHQTASRDKFIRSLQTTQKVADIMEVFLRAGVDVVMGTNPLLHEAILEVQQRVGRKVYAITTPSANITPDGPDWDSYANNFDGCVKLGTTFCWPHQSITDRMYDGYSCTIRDMVKTCRMIRERGMIPGLSSHLPETIVAADKTDLDVASYVCIYNSMGFMMPYEIDWTQRVIHKAKKPVTTIKPMAAGRVMPYVGLPFAWSTLRDQDLVTVGCLTPDEAKEVIEISLACLERRRANVELQTTRSKHALIKQ